MTGLPPDPDAVDDYLADGAPDAFDRVVDRLLASPSRGEHAARYWLDLARYGDTHGLHLDNERVLWKYREWVIDAYRSNLPYDRFVIDQLAGDLLPEATVEQRIATGFNRCNVTTGEGGSIDEEVLVRYAVDRTQTMAEVFMGLTAGCAVCHDHKFDPISQKEFYRLYAFFGSAADAAMDGNAAAPPPSLRVPAPEDVAALASLDEELAGLRRRIANELAAVVYVEPESPPPAESSDPVEVVWIDDDVPAAAKAGGNTPWELVTGPEHPVLSGEKSSRRAAEALSQHYFTDASPGLGIGEGDKLFAHVYLDPRDPPREIMLQWNDGSWEHRAYWGEDLIPWGESGGASRLPMGPLPKSGEWIRLDIDAEKVGLAPGAVVNGWAFTQHGGTVYWDRAGVVTRSPQGPQAFVSLARWESYERGRTKSELPEPVRQAIQTDPASRSAEQTKAIRDHFIEHVYGVTRPIFAPLHQEIERVTKARAERDSAIPVTLVMADLAEPRATHVLIRGQYDKKGEKVEPGVPAALPPLPPDVPANRLGLARWLVDPAHPLTARVAVNRMWQQFFGKGIVKTAEDFGAQGEWPSHPELLDWLAVEFVASGWDVKRFERGIVLSATYRQSSHVTEQLAERDPENILLARGPRYRLDAEAVRDSALWASGLLVDRIGGRSVKTYQPSGLWEAVGFFGSNTREYKRDDGDALYRRSLYTFWKRTAPPPSLAAFDAPSRETCVARRARTNTPLQALVLMNDEQYVEAARQLARRMLLEGGASPATRIVHGFRLVTSRLPDAEELAVLAGVLEQDRARFEADPQAAALLLAVGDSPRDPRLGDVEHAAYTLTANLILNLDETITKE